MLRFAFNQQFLAFMLNKAALLKVAKREEVKSTIFAQN